ncbi:MAG TPA: hypothetical protein ENH99_02185 [Candidatus Pacearchaeota archaeon]|nr:hypothetical protein [Candidatus Pacearchaeota archaeon]
MGDDEGKGRKTGEETEETPNYSGTGFLNRTPSYALEGGSLIRRISKLDGAYTKTDAFLLRDKEGNPITDPGQGINEVAKYLAWVFKASGESEESVRDLAERLYHGLTEAGLDGLLGGLEGKLPKSIEIPEGMPSYYIHQMTPEGRLHVHLTIDPKRNYDPLEAFLSIGKAGEREAAQIEALGRLVSYILRRSGTMGDVLDQVGGLGSSGRGIVGKEGFISTIEMGVEMALKKYYLRREIFGMGNILTGMFNPKYIKEVVIDTLRDGKFPEYVITEDGRKIQVEPGELIPKKNGARGHRPYGLILPRSPSKRKNWIESEEEEPDSVEPEPTKGDDNGQDGDEKPHGDSVSLNIEEKLEICSSCHKRGYRPSGGCGLCILCGWSDCS